MKRAKLGLFVGAIATSTFAAATPDAWDEWVRLSHARCPSHHVDWMPNDSYLFLVENFDGTLSKGQLRDVERIANTDRKCAGVWGGLGCNPARHMLAYQKLHLMGRFVRYGCLRIRCQETAMCSRAPTS